MGAGDADHVVAEVLDETLEVHRDEGLVLDDQDVGGDFRRHLAAGGIRQLAGLGDVGIENERHFLLGEAFEREQQERLPRQRRDVRQPALRRQRQRRDFGIVVERNRVPDLGEQLEQPGARAMPFVQQRAILQQGLQHGGHISIARGLVSGQRAGIAPQQRQMFSNEL